MAEEQQKPDGENKADTGMFAKIKSGLKKVVDSLKQDKNNAQERSEPSFSNDSGADKPNSEARSSKSLSMKTNKQYAAKFEKVTGVSFDDVEPGSLRLEQDGNKTVLRYRKKGEEASHGMKFQNADLANKVKDSLEGLQQHRASIVEKSHAHNIDEVAFARAKQDPNSAISMRIAWKKMLESYSVNKFNAGLEDSADFNHATLAANEIMNVLELDYADINSVAVHNGDLYVDLKDGNMFVFGEEDQAALNITDYDKYADEIAQVMNNNVVRARGSNTAPEAYDLRDEQSSQTAKAEAAQPEKINGRYLIPDLRAA